MKVKLLLSGFAMLFTFSMHAQGLVEKSVQKPSQTAEQALEKKAKDNTRVKSVNTDEQTGDESNPGSNSSDEPANKGDVPTRTVSDVKQNLADAETSYKSEKYMDARYAVQQAILGVEMEIGQEILKFLPETVSNLLKVAESDQVNITGYGWAGLTIVREYRVEDKKLKATIANNSAWMYALNLYLENTSSQTAYSQQTWKQTNIKGYKAIIEYDESSGYKLSVPLGQSSLIFWEGINYASEQEMLNAANTFDIDGIKKMLGKNK